RILSDDEHGLEGSRVGSIQHLDEGSSSVGRKFAFPLLRDPLTIRVAGDGAGSGKKFGDGSHFDRALVIVFLGERRKTTARTIQLSYQKKQIEESHTSAVTMFTPQQELSGQDNDPTRSRRDLGRPDKRIRLDSGCRLEVLTRSLLQRARNGVEIRRIP